jgi:hypothetical protein
MNANKETMKVDKNHYLQRKYASLERFISYFYQIDFIRKAKAKKILFIGVGDGLVSDYLKKIPEMEIVTYDIDPALHPDVVGDVRRLNFKDNEFDLVAAFEVLEHIPFKEFPMALSDLARISKEKVILSLPFRQMSFELIIRLPFIRTLFKRSFLRFLWIIPIRFPGPEVSGQHYWEIDRKQFPIKKIRLIIKKNFDILFEQKALLNPYRYFFILQKKKI